MLGVPACLPPLPPAAAFSASFGPGEPDRELPAEADAELAPELVPLALGVPAGAVVAGGGVVNADAEVAGLSGAEAGAGAAGVLEPDATDAAGADGVGPVGLTVSSPLV